MEEDSSPVVTRRLSNLFGLLGGGGGPTASNSGVTSSPSRSRKSGSQSESNSLKLDDVVGHQTSSNFDVGPPSPTPSSPADLFRSEDAIQCKLQTVFGDSVTEFLVLPDMVRASHSHVASCSEVSTFPPAPSTVADVVIRRIQQHKQMLMDDDVANDGDDINADDEGDSDGGDDKQTAREPTQAVAISSGRKNTDPSSRATAPISSSIEAAYSYLVGSPSSSSSSAVSAAAPGTAGVAAAAAAAAAQKQSSVSVPLAVEFAAVARDPRLLEPAAGAPVDSSSAPTASSNTGSTQPSAALSMSAATPAFQFKSFPKEVLHLYTLQSLLLENHSFSQIPNSFGKLHQLQTCIVRRCAVRTLPPTLAGLRQLQLLDLSGNAIAGQFPPLPASTRLTTLILDDNSLTSLPDLGLSCPSLTILSVQRNRLSGSLPPSVSCLSRLTELRLSSNQLKDVSAALGPLRAPALQCLLLDKNRLGPRLPSTLGADNAFPLLTQLDVSGNLLTELPESVYQLTALRQLNAAENQLQTVEFAGLASLCSVNLSNNRLSSLPPSTGSLAQLTQADFSGNLLASPAALAPLRGLPVLRSLSLSNNGLSALPVCLAGLPQLHTLLCAENKIQRLPGAWFGDTAAESTDTDHVAVASDQRFQSLRLLDLHQNELQSLPPTFGSCFSSLLELNLADCPLISLEPFVAMRKLRVLWLDSARLRVLPPQLPLSLQQLSLVGMHIYIDGGEPTMPTAADDDNARNPDLDLYSSAVRVVASRAATPTSATTAAAALAPNNPTIALSRTQASILIGCTMSTRHPLLIAALAELARGPRLGSATAPGSSPELVPVAAGDAQSAPDIEDGNTSQRIALFESNQIPQLFELLRLLVSPNEHGDKIDQHEQTGVAAVLVVRTLRRLFESYRIRENVYPPSIDLLLQLMGSSSSSSSSSDNVRVELRRETLALVCNVCLFDAHQQKLVQSIAGGVNTFLKMAPAGAVARDRKETETLSPGEKRDQQLWLRLLSAVGAHNYVHFRQSVASPRTQARTTGVRILCIDGGGTRGLTALAMLEVLEEMTGLPPYAMFDIICGTSTGGILAMLLGVRRYPIAKCRTLYTALCKKVFHTGRASSVPLETLGLATFGDEELPDADPQQPPLQPAVDPAQQQANAALPKPTSSGSRPPLSSSMSQSGSNIKSPSASTWAAKFANYGSLLTSGAFYSSKPLTHFLKETGGVEQLLDTSGHHQAPKVFVCAALTSVLPGQPFLFRNYQYPAPDPDSPWRRPRFPGSCGRRVFRSLRASSAAPSYFEPCSLAAASDQSTDKGRMQDGGLVANNPSAVALSEAQRLFPGQPVDLILSLGTGRGPLAEFHDTGIRSVVKLLVKSATNSDRTAEILEDALRGTPTVYVRVNPIDKAFLSALDETDDGRLNDFTEAGRKGALDRIEDFKRMATILKTSRFT